MDVTFDPKPEKGDWNGSGCHTNFSFESTRKEEGYERIIQAMTDYQTHSNGFERAYNWESEIGKAMAH